MRTAEIWMHNQLAGILTESEDGYSFKYESSYLSSSSAAPISLSMPLNEEQYLDRTLFPFFDGLIPEGWLLDIAEKTWKIDSGDRMGLLLACCRDCIGAVSVIEKEDEQ